MNSFFGIGPLELMFILIFALIFLGPERLPGAVRQIASFIRQIQNLSSTLSQQLGDEFGDLSDLDPRVQFQQMLDEPDEKEKEAAKEEEEKKKADAKKAAEKRKADAKKKADEAKKKAEEDKKAQEAAAVEVEQSSEGTDVPSVVNETAADETLLDESPSVAPAMAAVDATTSTEPTNASDASVVTDAPPPAKQPKQPSADEQTSQASAPFVKERAEARAAANALIPNTSDNSIAPPTHRAETPVNGKSDDSAASSEAADSPTQTADSPVVEEEQA